MALSMAEAQLACFRAVGQHIGGVPYKSVANGETNQTTARIALGYLSDNQYEVVMNTRSILAQNAAILANQQKIMAALEVD